MNIRCLLLSLLLATTLFGMQDPELKTSRKIAGILLSHNKIDPSEAGKKRDLVAWLWRGDNYQKPCKYEEFKTYSKQIAITKEIKKKYDEVKKDKDHSWADFKDYLDSCTGDEILLALHIYTLLPNPKGLIDRIVEQLYRDVATNRRIIELFEEPLKKSPISILDFDAQKIAAYEFIHHKNTTLEAPRYTHKNINFFAEKDLIIMPGDGAQCLMSARTEDGKILSPITPDMSMLKKDPLVPFIWQPNNNGEKHVFTKNAFTLTLDPTNNHIEFKTHDTLVASMECASASQFAYDNTNIFVCAPTFHPQTQKNQSLSSLIVDFSSGYYFLLDHQYAQTTSDAPINPEVFCKHGIVFINWHDRVDIFSPRTDTLISQISDNWIETMQLSPDGNYLLACEKTSENKKAIIYTYRLLEIVPKQMSLLKHLREAEQVNNPNGFETTFAGLGLGKALSEKGKLVGKE